MIEGLAEVNRQEQDRHRNRMIEEAYSNSQQRHYSMPRSLLPQQEDSFDSIPSIYDLHAQNRQPEGGKLQPVGLLITLKGKYSLGGKTQGSTTATTKKATLAHLSQMEQPRRTRIQCTLSLAKKNSVQFNPSLPKQGWLCCPKEDTFDQFQTRQLTLRTDHRQSTLLSSLIPPEKHPPRRGRQQGLSVKGCF